MPWATAHEGSAAGGQAHTELTPAAPATGPLYTRPGVLGARPRRVTSKVDLRWPSPFLFSTSNGQTLLLPPFFFLKNRQNYLPGVSLIGFGEISNMLEWWRLPLQRMLENLNSILSQKVTPRR